MGCEMEEKDLQGQLPEAFIRKMQQLLGDEWEAFFYSYAHEKYQALRLNPLKKGVDAAAYDAILEAVKVEDRQRVPWAEHAFYYGMGARPGKHPYHEMGLYYIQEPSAMSAAALLAPKPGMRVLDLCAAPGGKSTQLASFLQQEGLLVANEIHPARCKILSQNIERMGICNAIVTNEDSAALEEHFRSYFHAVLVDAPCSGEGMFRKNPKAMEEWSRDQVQICAGRQREILHHAAAMLMPGGKLVYSTCTFSPEENEQTIEQFLSDYPEFEVQEQQAPWFEKGMCAGTYRLWPHKLHGEGHFVAVLHKKGTLCEDWNNGASAAMESEDSHKAGGKKKDRMKSKHGIEQEKMQALLEFCGQSLGKQMTDWILAGKLIWFKDQLYRLPQEAPSLAGLKVLRAGLHIGEFKKNRLEPSHALALAIGTGDVQLYADLNRQDRRTESYFKGESFAVSEEEIHTHSAGSSVKGWCLVCVDGYAAGWGKYAAGQVKNHYPKGLRRNLESAMESLEDVVGVESIWK